MDLFNIWQSAQQSFEEFEKEMSSLLVKKVDKKEENLEFAICDVKDKKPKKSTDKFNAIKKTFLEFYLKQTEIEYYFTAADAAATKQLEKKIKFSLQKVDLLDITENYVYSFQTMLDKLPKWHLEKLSLKNINSKYNEIISEIRSTNGQSTNKKGITTEQLATILSKQFD